MVPGQVGKVYNQIWLVGASYFVPVLQISGIQIQKYIRPFIRRHMLHTYYASAKMGPRLYSKESKGRIV